MKINVVIGNPPYQEMDGGGKLTESSLPLYNRFILKFMNTGIDYMTMIIPSRWMSGGKQELNEFRTKLINCKKIQLINVYKRCWDVFDNVDIPGGVQYLLYNRYYNDSNCNIINNQIVDNKVVKESLTRKLSDYKYLDNFNNYQYMIVGDNKSIGIINKILKLDELRMTQRVLPRSPFGLDSLFEDSEIYTEDKPIKVICSNGRKTFTSIDKITDNYNKLDKYKVIVGKVNPDRGGNNNSQYYNVISKPTLLGKNEICTTTYLVLDSFDTIDEANNFISYVKTRLFRFLAYVTLSGTSMSNRNYMFIPVQDYSKCWNDNMLNFKYSLDTSEVNYINSIIKEW